MKGKKKKKKNNVGEVWKRKSYLQTNKYLR